MKVDHITYKGNSVVRDTEDVLKTTINHFKDFENGSVELPISKTPFTCKVTVDNGMAVFDIKKNEALFCTNFCCYNKIDRNAVLMYCNDLINGMKGDRMILNPKSDMFIITFIINPFAVTHQDMQLAGEIELYIFNAILRGLKNV